MVLASVSTLEEGCTPGGKLSPWGSWERPQDSRVCMCSHACVRVCVVCVHLRDAGGQEEKQPERDHSGLYFPDTKGGASGGVA